MIGRIPVRRDSCMSRSLVPSRTMRSCTAMSQHRLIMVTGRGPIIRMFMQFIRKCKDLWWWLMTVCFSWSRCRQTYGLAFSGPGKTAECCNWWILHSIGANGRKFCWLTSNFQIKAGGNGLDQICRTWVKRGQCYHGSQSGCPWVTSSLSTDSTDLIAEFGSQIIRFFPNFIFLMLRKTNFWT